MRKLLLLSLFIIHWAPNIYAQTISPGPGFNTVCPDTPIDYSASPPVSGCTSYTWTITNGTFFPGNATTSTGTAVTVKWNDEAKIGKLKVTLTCGSETYSKEESYAIHSLKNVAPQNPRISYGSLNYCSITPVTLAVDRVDVPNTGSGTSIPVKPADGYEWTLPGGQIVYTTTEYYTYQPINGCIGGNVSVRAFVDRCLPNFSNSVSINVNRAALDITVTPPSGYGGSSWCNQNGVTFTATPVSCFSNYVWSFPSGWTGPDGASPNTVITGNTITLYPSGSEADEGEIVAKVNLDCGTLLTSSSYAVTYTPPNPIISGGNLLCSGSTTYTLSNAPAGTYVSWSSDTPSLLSINSTSGVATRIGSGSGKVIVTANILGGCQPLSVNKVVWVGKPSTPVPTEWTNYILCEASALLRVEDAPVYMGVSVQWTKSGPITLGSTAGFKAIVTSTGMSGTAAANVKFTNTCGNTTFYGPFMDIECYYFTASPNPATNELLVSFDTNNIEGKSATVTTRQVSLVNEQQQNVFTASSAENEIRIPVKHLPNGLYILRVISGQTKSEKRIVIDHP